MNRTTVDLGAVSLSGTWKSHGATILAFVLLLWLLGPSAFVLKAQDAEDPLLNIGVPPLSLTIPVESGYINAGNGQLTIEVPMASLPQRAGKQLALRFDVGGPVWSVVNTGWGPNPPSFDILHSTPSYGWGTWGGGDKLGTICRLDGVEEWDTFGGFFYNVDGTSHPFSLNTTMVNTVSACGLHGTDVPSADGLALDGSGYHMYVVNYTEVSAVYAPDGTLVYSEYPAYPNYYNEDSNGNQTNWYKYDPSFDIGGRPPVTETTSGSTTTYAVSNSKGGTSTYTVTSATINVNSDFQATTTNTGTDYTGTTQVTQSIQLPDLTSYTFKYDCDSTINSSVWARRAVKVRITVI